ncbi:hypothetical protein ACIQWV_40050 [Streptomyces sp. NPDC098085]|uniref:hypothetical protein n=1 Tax=Streptomyces sp. NPDC098085 TaxID=3366094 RepID=UPI0037F61D17
MTEKRTRSAVDKLVSHQFDRHGNRIWTQARQLLEHEHARLRIGQVSVPYGICVEPSNVKAGGHGCPFRFRCVGCDHFRTDPSYLPELRAYLDTLLRDRERLTAATEVDDWARTESTPSEEEIKRIRTLIRRVETDLEGLTDDEREQIKEATRTLRKTRTVSLGTPGIRSPEPNLRLERDVTTSPDHLTRARAADSERRKVPRPEGAGPARRQRRGDQCLRGRPHCRLHHSLIHRHDDLHAAVLARAAEPLPDATVGAQVSRKSLLADVANLTARNGRLSAHITRLERRLSATLGQAAWEASGLGAPADIETLTHRVTELEQQVLDLRAELDERDEDLAAARAANRELMAQLNR